MYILHVHLIFDNATSSYINYRSQYSGVLGCAYMYDDELLLQVNNINLHQRMSCSPLNLPPSPLSLPARCTAVRRIRRRNCTALCCTLTALALFVPCRPLTTAHLLL